MKSEEEAEIFQKEHDDEKIHLKNFDNYRIIYNSSIINLNLDESQNIKIILILIFVLFFMLTFFYSKKTIAHNYEDSKIELESRIKYELKRSMSEPNRVIVEKSNKTNIAFVYHKITRFMVATGEYFIKTGKYEIYFLTKPSEEGELKFNSTIKRINIYNSPSLLPNFCRNHDINFVIVNDYYPLKQINEFKKYNIKVIGMFFDSYGTAVYKNFTMRKLNNIYYFSAFLHETYSDFLMYRDLSLSNNIIIPNVYPKSKSVSLENKNIMMIGELTTKKNIAKNIINSIPLIIKEIPKVKLNIISLEKPHQELINLVKKLKLSNNVKFIHVKNKYYKYFTFSSLFLYPSFIEAFPLAIYEAKSYGIPCITSNDITKYLPYLTDIIKLDVSNAQILSKEIIKLLKNVQNLKKIGKNSKSSLDKHNNISEQFWYLLFKSLNNDNNIFRNFRYQVEEVYSKNYQNVGKMVAKKVEKKETKKEDKKVEPKKDINKKKENVKKEENKKIEIKKVDKGKQVAKKDDKRKLDDKNKNVQKTTKKDENIKKKDEKKKIYIKQNNKKEVPKIENKSKEKKDKILIETKHQKKEEKKDSKKDVKKDVKKDNKKDNNKNIKKEEKGKEEKNQKKNGKNLSNQKKENRQMPELIIFEY